MSQNDFIIANQSAPNFRSDLNDALQALASLSSGASEPSTTYANMLWYDTGNNILKMRSEADDAWINISYLDQTANAFRLLDDTQVVNTSGTQTGLLGDQATATWEAGTSTTESLVSPAKVKAAVEALASVTEAGPTTVSGTEVDFTSIPSGVNEIVATFNAVQFGTPNYIAARLGTSAGVATTGYEAVMLGLNQVGSPLADAQSTYVVTRAGTNNSALGNVSGVMRFIREPGGNVWVFEHNLHTYQSNTNHNQSTGSGRVTLPGTLDRVRFFGDNGGLFSSGKIALRYL